MLTTDKYFEEECFYIYIYIKCAYIYVKSENYIVI